MTERPSVMEAFKKHTQTHTAKRLVCFNHHNPPTNQYRIQSPQAPWTVGGRRERLWRSEKKNSYLAWLGSLNIAKNFQKGGALTM